MHRLRTDLCSKVKCLDFPHTNTQTNVQRTILTAEGLEARGTRQNLSSFSIKFTQRHPAETMCSKPSYSLYARSTAPHETLQGVLPMLYAQSMHGCPHAC